MAPHVHRQSITFFFIAALLLLIGHHYLILLPSDRSTAAVKEKTHASLSLSLSSSVVRAAAHLYTWQTWHNEQTMTVETLGESKFARCDVHTLSSEDGTTVIRDWLILEEAPAVNIIVRTLEENQFVVFRQKKYAIPGETLSPVGGFIDLGESPLVAAKREVLEELGLGSRQTLELVQRSVQSVDSVSLSDIAKIIADHAIPAATDEYGLLVDQSSPRQTTPNVVEYDPDWVFLGRYRTSANRGGGFLYSYLLNNAVSLLPGGGTGNFVGGTGDYESQTILYLTDEEVMDALLDGRFQEVKWTATLALAMLHLKKEGGSVAVR